MSTNWEQVAREFVIEYINEQGVGGKRARDIVRNYQRAYPELLDAEGLADGKAGNQTFGHLRGFGKPAGRGDRFNPTVPDVFKSWAQPMAPIMLGGKLRHFKTSSGFTMYGKGADPDRKNHWGVDLMLKRYRGDVTDAMADSDMFDAVMDGPSYGAARAPIWDPYWFCPHGVALRAVGPGKVWSVHIGSNNNVLIDHGNVEGFGPLTTWYQHMDRVIVEDGQPLQAGEKIGTVGDGSSNLNHLHFEFRDYSRGSSRESTVVNPVPFLKAMQL